ncbi:MAG TPA: ABC transporter substrate-binding protein [Sporichthya sp.]|nr:ABC transporter substrate-binding protein [Sporichthya sp.]
MAPPRSRRLLTALAASVTAMALVAGCGGSDVQDAAVGAGDTTAAQTDTAGATTSDSGTGTDAAAPGAHAPAAVDAAVPGARNAPAGGAVGGADAATKGGPRKGGDKAAAVGGANAAAGASGSAVEQLVATAPIFGGKAACRPATLSPVTIGNVSTLSGVLGELFAPLVPALGIFVASQNACGGLNGHKITLALADDQGDPSTASTKVQELIQSKKVLTFVGNQEPLTVDAIVPIIKKYGIPVIGSDLTNNTWFTNPLMFPQGSSGQGVGYGYLEGALNYFKKKNVGNLWCIEVPRACEQINRSMKELAPQVGATFKKDIQVSITAPSYVQQCLDLKGAGVEALALTFDAATMVRVARSCTQVGYFPKIMPYPLGLGNEKQFLQGNKWLGDAYVTMNAFPWFANATPFEQYWQASVKKFNPGFDTGGAASIAWSSAALLVAAAAELSPTNPSTQDLLKVLWQFKGQKFTELGGMTAPLTFQEGGAPKVPYCLFAGIVNAADNGWAKSIDKPTCTKILAPSDPQNQA